MSSFSLYLVNLFTILDMLACMYKRLFKCICRTFRFSYQEFVIMASPVCQCLIYLKLFFQTTSQPDFIWIPGTEPSNGMNLLMSQIIHLNSQDSEELPFKAPFMDTVFSGIYVSPFLRIQEMFHPTRNTFNQFNTQGKNILVLCAHVQIALALKSRTRVTAAFFLTLTGRLPCITIMNIQNAWQL